MAARNAFKGYSYQENVFRAYFMKMDLERAISKIEAEVDSEKIQGVNNNFDDIYVKTNNDDEYFVQVKNYVDVDISKIKVSDNEVIIKGNHIKYSKNHANIIILNTNFETNKRILGFNAYEFEGIYFIPLTEDNFDEQVGIYADVERKDKIISIVDNSIHNAIFQLTLKDLPDLTVYSMDLSNETVFLHEIKKDFTQSNETIWFVGSPGCGKSHLVNEYINYFDEQEMDYYLYRFHRFDEDRYNKDRLLFKNFLLNLVYENLGTPKKFDENEIVSELNKLDKIFLFDGIDHIENYAPKGELKLFLDFFDKLDNVNVLIFSRYLKTIDLKNKNIEKVSNWSKSETINYLKFLQVDDLKHDIIFDKTQGHPLLTYYFSEHVKKGGNIGDFQKINEINEFYDNIISNVEVYEVLGSIILNTSYFLIDDFKLFEEYDFNIITSFLNKYPFLFTRQLNRVFLFHDSFNTYLRNNVSVNNRILDTIKNSIKSKEINFLSRFDSFNFEDEFIKEIIKLYADFDVFKEISNNFDFESIKIFYNSLKYHLITFDSFLDVYQYYSFILICNILERNDYISQERILFQYFIFGQKREYNESNIYSNGVLWSLYYFTKTDDISLYLDILEKNYYNLKNFKDLKDIYTWEKDFSIYNPFNGIVLDDKIFESRIKKSSLRYKYFEDYLVYIWVNKKTESKYYSFLSNYFKRTFDKNSFDKFCDDLKISEGVRYRILNDVKEKLWGLGYFEKDNIFLNNSFSDLLKLKSKIFSTDLESYVLRFLRLINNGYVFDLDFKDVFKYFNNYLFRKDYSVSNMDKALLLFEKYGCIMEDDSLNLIVNTMSKSEKGIRKILSNYLNAKNSSDLVESLINDDKYEFRISNLNSEVISGLSKEIVEKEIYSLLKFNSFNIYFNDVENIVYSKHGELLNNILGILKIKIFNVPKEHENYLKSNFQVEYELLKNRDDKNIPKFNDRDYLVANDSVLIKNFDIKCTEIANRTNGFRFCLPYPEFFQYFDEAKIKENCLDIIKISISVCPFGNHVGMWDLCLGNIVYLLNLVNYDVNWDKLFDIFMNFFNLSNIYLDSSD